MGDIEFKSYYVVWKLINAGRIIQIAIGFKSYYVVWKRFFATNRASAVPAFKSYYVVWKRFPSEYISFLLLRLNRTM